ncbi:septation protein SepH [Actinomadura miaoliensis]|uniref:DUF3071 domain-containing protein n=1 Tax=Actinomadura miaoliensis TaxID=430685 RepID=A0ABP7VQM6_9ACTN
MQELRLVAVSEDGTYLVLATAGRGTRFTLPVDDRLRAAVRGHFSRLGQFEIEVESPLRPKEIQARIRSGETAEEIAESAGIPVERVRWFEGPVLQEREYMAQQAQRVAVRRPGESTPGPPLGETVEERLGRGGVDLEDVEWDSWKCEDNTWRVRLSFFENGRPHAAEWVFDPRRRHVSPLDEVAARLTAVDWDDEDDSLGDTVTPLVPRRPAMKVVSDAREFGVGPAPVPGPAARGIPAGYEPPAEPPLRAAVPTRIVEPRPQPLSLPEAPAAPPREASVPPPREEPAAAASPPGEGALAASPAPAQEAPQEPQEPPQEDEAAAAEAQEAPEAATAEPEPRPEEEQPAAEAAEASEHAEDSENSEAADADEPQDEPAEAEPQPAEAEAATETATEAATDDEAEAQEAEEAPQPEEAEAAQADTPKDEPVEPAEPEPPAAAEEPQAEPPAETPAEAPAAAAEPEPAAPPQEPAAPAAAAPKPAPPQRPAHQPARPAGKKKSAGRPAMPAAQVDKPGTGTPAGDAPAPQRPARNRRRAKGKRASVPSWDEIMFGARRPD